jgi:hypothetical protein
MNTLNFSDRIDRLQTLRREHRLIRREWVGKDADGRELACLLVALSPEAGNARDAGACPASVLSPWFAYLTPWIDDAGSKRAWEAMVARYVAIVERWHTLTPERDRCLEYAVRALAVREAMRHTSDASVLAVCERVATLCEGVAAGGAIDAEAFTAEEAAASAEEAAWAGGAAEKASAAKEAAWVKAPSARAAVAAAAWATGVSARAWATATSAAAASAAEAASWTAAEAAASAAASWAAADRLTDAILGACERELGIAKEGG